MMSREGEGGSIRPKQWKFKVLIRESIEKTLKKKYLNLER